MKDMSVYEEINDQTETVLSIDKKESPKKDVESSNLTQKVDDNSSPNKSPEKNTDSTDTENYFTPVYAGESWQNVVLFCLCGRPVFNHLPINSRQHW